MMSTDKEKLQCSAELIHKQLCATEHLIAAVMPNNVEDLQPIIRKAVHRLHAQAADVAEQLGIDMSAFTGGTAKPDRNDS